MTVSHWLATPTAAADLEAIGDRMPDTWRQSRMVALADRGPLRAGGCLAHAMWLERGRRQSLSTS